MVDVIDKLELGGFFELSEGKRKLMILNPNFIGISTDFKNREFSDTLLYYLVDSYKKNEDVITNQLTYLRKSIEIPTSPILEHFKILFLH